MTDCPYFRIMSATRGKIEHQRQVRELLRAVRDNAPAPVRNQLAEAIEDVLYGRMQ